jgi:DNA-directed RNA polymerase specialized sigma24 family protein
MEADTDIGGPARGFPATRHSAVAALQSGDEVTRARALDTLLAAYWKPAYKYVRIHWRADNERAKDLTQGLFADVVERRLLEKYDATKGSFRNYVRLLVDGHVANELKAASRQKRGGGARHVPIDVDEAEGELAAHPPSPDLGPDALFEREWARALFGRAVDLLRERLEASGKAVHFVLFRRYDLDADEASPRPTYDQLAREHGLPVTQVTNFLFAARRELRRAVLDLIREATATEAEFRAEARAILGVDPP